MFSTTDTIVAIATPPGRGAIGVVRLSGPRSRDIGTHLLDLAAPLRPRRATRARLYTSDAADDVIATFFPGPGSYTGDDVLELSAHGSNVVLQAILRAAVGHGARLAAPGEFTLRAYLHGKLDLVQAEAVADLIEAVTPLQARSAFDQLNGTLTSELAGIERMMFELEAELEASIDFPDEGYHFIGPSSVTARLQDVVSRIDRILASSKRGRLIREGARVVIAGAPNAGKSSLFNAMLGANRAIVSDVPGTTRDMVTEVVDLHGLRVTLVDTAGLATSGNSIEQEGMSRARSAADDASLVLVVADGSSPRATVDLDVLPERRLLVVSKVDLPQVWSDNRYLPVSVAAGTGLSALISRISSRLVGEEIAKDNPFVSNLRHIGLLERASVVLAELIESVRVTGVPSEEFVLVDLRSARRYLEEVTGRRGDDDLLAEIFSRFCIGK